MKPSLVVFLALFMICVPVFAHHGSTAYDTSKVVVLKGAMVTKYVWANPHVIITFDVKDEKGNVVQWIGEWNAPSTLVNFGFSPKTFKFGEEVTVTFSSMSKNGALVGRLKSVKLPDGTVMSEDESFGRAREPR